MATNYRTLSLAGVALDNADINYNNRQFPEQIPAAHPMSGLVLSCQGRRPRIDGDNREGAHPAGRRTPKDKRKQMKIWSLVSRGAVAVPANHNSLMLFTL